MRRLLGPHLGGQWANKLELLRKWQPPFVLVLQPEVDKVTQLREACPRAIITGRFYHEDSHYASNISARPKEFAREIHQEIVGNPVTPLLDYVQSNNETNQDWQGIQKLNQFTQEWMALADQSQAYKCAILAFSVGNPDMPHKPGDPAGFDGRMLYWQQVLPSLNYAQRNNHILLLHAYGYPSMFAPDADWYIYRYERQVQANLRKLGITNLKYAYGEIGIDRLIVNGKGGYKVVTNDQDYVNQLLQWEKDQQGQSLLLGGAIFTFGDSGGWDTYDIASADVASLVATHYADHANEYQSPAIGATQVPEETNLPYVPNESAPTAPQPELPPREISADFRRRVPTLNLIADDFYLPYYRLIKAEYVPNGAQRFGPDHHILVEVLDKDGKRQMNVPVHFWWGSDSTDVPTNKTGGPYAADYAMTSHGHSYGCQVGLDRALSDGVFGMGLGTIEQPDWNHHVTYYLVFQEVIPQAQPKPPTEQPQPAASLWYVTATDGLNLRESPNDNSKIITAIPFREVVRVVAISTIKGWVRARYGNQEGWVSSQYISLKEPEKPAQPEPVHEVVGDKWARTYAFTKKWEGEYQNVHNDAGNWTGGKVGVGELKGTKYGISAASYPYLDIKNLTPQDAERIYLTDYWQASGASELPWPGCLVVFDTAVLHGVGTAAAWLGEVGPNPLGFAARRLRSYTKMGNWDFWGRAWVNRVSDLLEEAAK